MGEIKPHTERRESSGGGRRKNSTHAPMLESKGKSIRKGVTLHGQSVVPSQRQSERDEERSGKAASGGSDRDRVKAVAGTPSGHGIPLLYHSLEPVSHSLKDFVNPFSSMWTYGEEGGGEASVC